VVDLYVAVLPFAQVLGFAKDPALDNTLVGLGTVEGAVG